LVHSDDAGIKSVEYGNLVAPIIEAIKSLTIKVQDLFAKYVDQEARINALEQRLQKLELQR
jgi:UDP-N-acetylmuramyl tripeptide synthase